jgi:hypothetical protein
MATANQSITEESPSASSPPIQKMKEEEPSMTAAAQVYTHSSQTTVQTNSNCIMEEIEEKMDCGATIS